jgi:uncharacterized protein involved in outer membrane biogenesis
MRKIAIAVGIVIVFVVAVVLIFAATFNVNKYHDTIQSELQKQLGRPVALGKMGLGIFPPRFRVQNLQIGEDPSFTTQAPFVTTRSLDVSVRLLPLLHKRVEIASVNLQQPNVQLIRNKQGVWNFASLGKPGTPVNGPAAQPPPSAPPSNGQAPQPQTPSAGQFSLGKLTIRDGQVSVLDLQTSNNPSVYSHINLTLKNFAPDKPFQIDAALRLPGTGTQEVRLQGQGGPIAQAQPAETPFHGTLSLKEISLANLSQYLHSPALAGSDGTITGQTKIDAASGKVTAQGETRIENAKIHGQDLGYPIDATYDLTDELASQMITLRNVVVKLGTAPLQLSGTVQTKTSPAQLDLTTKASNVSLTDMARLAALFGNGLPPGTNVTGNLNADVQARGPANKPALNGTLTTGDVQIGGGQIAQPVQIQPVNIHLTPAQVQSNQFNVVSGGTTLNTQFAVNNYMAPAPVVAATVKAANAQLPAILAMAKAYGVKSLDKVSGAGVLNLDMRATGPVKALNSREIMKALNGTINLNLNNVKYSGADMGQEISKVAGFLKPASNSGGVTTISKLTGDILVKSGIATTNNMQAVLDWGNLGITGSTNLADQTLNLRALAALSQASSQQVGGNQVGGFLHTALANSKGELVVPVLITGTFSNPKFAPDVQQAAQMKLKGLVPNGNNPGDLVGALLGGKNPAQTQPPNSNQQPASANPAQQLLGLFGKKKK